MSGIDIYIRVGHDFHGGSEFYELPDAIDPASASAETRRRGYISGFSRICEIAQKGFSSVKHLFEKADIDEIWVFEDSGFRMALRIPGDGRADTKDAELIISEFYVGEAAEREISRPDFIDRAKLRLNNGWVESHTL